MTAPVEISLKASQHRTTVSHALREWAEAAAQVRNLLTSVETRGEFGLRPIRQCTLKGNHRIRIKHWNGKVLRLTVKPLDNDSAWEYELIPPHQLVDGATLCEILKRKLGKATDERDERDEKDEKDQEYDDPGAEAPEDLKGEQVVGLSSSPDTRPAIAEQPAPAPAPVAKHRSLLQRVSEMEANRQRIYDRKEQLTAIENEKARLTSEIETLVAGLRFKVEKLDHQALAIMEADEADTEAYEAKELLDNLERLFAK